MSKVKVTRPLWLVILAGQHGQAVMVTYPYAYMTYIVSPLAGLGGSISWRPPAYSLFIEYLNCTTEKLPVPSVIQTQLHIGLIRYFTSAFDVV